MPLTAGGKLSIVTSSDLGGLGARDGPPVEYTWVLPSVWPQLLPWLAILGLLALKSNRTAAAWLIWLPVGGVLAFTIAPPLMAPGGEFFLDAIAALVFGLAAVWLLSNHLRQSHRLLTFLSVLFTLAGFSALAFLSRQSWNLTDFELLPTGVLLGVGVLTSAVALSLDGWICRRRFRPLGLYLWLFLSLAVVWLAVAAPLFVLAQISSGWRMSWGEFFIPILAVASGNFALLLPFLILSSASPFFRERLKALLNFEPEPPPMLSVPAQETPLKI